MNLYCYRLTPPLGGVLAAYFYKSLGKQIKITYGNRIKVIYPDGRQSVPYETDNDVIRILENEFNESSDALQKLSLNHWLTFSQTIESNMPESIQYLDQILTTLPYLNGETLSVSDLQVYSVLYLSPKFRNYKKSNPARNILRWIKLIEDHPAVVQAMAELPPHIKDILKGIASGKSSVGKEVVTEKQPEGKFIDLPYAQVGKVVVRFPPEASGYLHIGHAKAALLNQYYQQAFQGKLIMRFDDTNPAKENAHFEKVILEDLQLLEIKPDSFSYTSNFFYDMMQKCEQLISEGKAYVDDTPAEQMKTERELKINSESRYNSVEKNLQLWEEMKKGSTIGMKCCVRAKIDMQSTNGCMRDPTIYRCKVEEHVRTHWNYKVYPTYDFACPIVDSLEDVTHVLRTMEYHDRDAQFYWFIDALGLRKPYIWEYSRLNMTNTVLSKRKLTWFVEQGLVDGWDDPRMPTVRGVLRRGMTVEALRQFIRAQGSSRSVVFMEWDKIWAINKKVIDPIVPRYTALEMNPVPVILKNVVETELKVPLHPKNEAAGSKKVWIAPRLLIDHVDAKTLKVGENATFINYGNVIIDKIHKHVDGTIRKIEGTPNLENKDFKKTVKLTWLADTDLSPEVEVHCVYFDHLISKPILGKDEDFKNYVGHPTRWEVKMIGEPELRKVREGAIIQLQRRGFFRVDVAPESRPSYHTLRTAPLVLFHVPDGHTKENPGQPKPKPSLVQEKQVAAEEVSPLNPQVINDKIVKQVELLRKSMVRGALKDSALKTLLELKIDYLVATGKEWKPSEVPKPAASSVPSDEPLSLDQEISKQGDLVRQLKAAKADKAEIAEAVKILLELKAKYKAATGTEWKPSEVPKPAASSVPSDEALSLDQEISKQGDLVRQLKAAKADKAEIAEAVKILLELKAKYKAATGTEWTSCIQLASTSASADYTQDYAFLVQEVRKQTEIVEELKTEKAYAAKIDAAERILARLKVQIKSKETEQYSSKSSSEPKTDDCQLATLVEQITAQGDKVRKIKAEKAAKSVVDVEVKNLLNLKAQYKAIAKKDWTPNVVPPPKTIKPQAASMSGDGDKAKTLGADITKQGDLVRKLKTEKADKATIDAEVKKLLELKAEYRTATGTDFAPPVQPRDVKPKEKKEKPKDVKKEKKEPSPKPVKEESSSGLKRLTRLGVEASKDADLSEWYTQVITKSEMIDYYDISGCYILRPWSYSIWDRIRHFLTAEFRKLGVKDGYFPIFVSKAALEREKAHIADFAPEVAWVTHSGGSELAEHIAVRPTSETVMYPAYAKWIQSHRDLPFKLNQWNNVVRWEFKQPQPFLRTREFLWQEGHTAFRTKEEAAEEVLQILDLYARVYEELMAVPVVKGRKTEKEKFAGSDYTTTVEGYIPASGRGIQGATSHHLGQNFSKMFEIVYDDPDTQEKNYVYQNSWGITTRTIGVMVLVHGDDVGLVLPPRLADIQAIVVPCGITASSSAEERKNLLESCKALVSDLIDAGIRSEGDYRDNYSPGWKFNHWELKGVPIRVELGPKDIARGEVVAVRRLTGEKLTLKRADAGRLLVELLEKTHDEMFAKALKERNERTSVVNKWEDFTNALEKKHLLMAPFCGEIACEDNIKADSARTGDDQATDARAPAMGAKSLCIPFEPPRQLTDTDKCIHPSCTNKPKFITLFGRSY